MKKLLFIIALLVSVTLVQAENENNIDAKKETTTSSIKGNVIDLNSGESLVGATVIIEGTATTVYTDLDGNFQIDNVKPGTYSLVVSYISYNKSLVENVVVQPSKEMNLEVRLVSE